MSQIDESLAAADKKIGDRFEESRRYEEKAIGQLILVASGTIIVSINALNPLLRVTDTLQHLLILIISWIMLMVSILAGVLARFRLCEHTKQVGLQLDGELTDSHSKSQLDKAVGAMWLFFLLGLVLLLFFVGSNLLSAKTADEGAATSQQSTIVDAAPPVSQ